MSVVNILISLCLSSLIIEGALQWYILVKQDWEKSQARKIDQEVQKVIFQFLYQDLQSAGYRGIRTGDNGFPLYRHYSDYTSEYRYFRFDQTVFSFITTPGNCYGKMPYTACERQQENSEVLIIYNVPQTSVQLKQPMDQLDDALVTRGFANFQENSLMLISDHESSDACILTSKEGNILQHKKILGKNTSEKLSKLYTENAEVVELQTVAYYLGLPERDKNNKKEEDKDQGYSLFRDDFLHPAQELVSGVRKISFMYKEGDFTAEKELKNLKSNEVKNWSTVKSVQINVETKTGKTWKTSVVLRNAFTEQEGLPNASL